MISVTVQTITLHKFAQIFIMRYLGSYSTIATYLKFTNVSPVNSKQLNRVKTAEKQFFYFSTSLIRFILIFIQKPLTKKQPTLTTTMQKNSEKRTGKYRLSLQSFFYYLIKKKKLTQKNGLSEVQPGNIFQMENFATIINS